MICLLPGRTYYKAADVTNTKFLA